MSMCTYVPLEVIDASHWWIENTCWTFVFVILNGKSATSVSQTDINIGEK